MRTPPSRNVLDAFSATAEPQALEGGRGGTWRSGPIVLKPVDDAVESRWRASVLDAGPDSSCFRLARPIRAASGDWLHDGWEAAHHVVGRTDPSRWNDAIEAGAAFHEAIAEVARPSFLENRDDRWSRADRAAWAAAAVDGPPLLKRLMAARVPVEAEHRMVHGDLLGNVLYEPGLAPALIDWSPYWRPSAWAAAVAVVDAMCWHGAGERLIDHWTAFGEWPQMLLRALLFRMITDQEAAADGPWEPHPAYGPVAETLIRRALP